MISKHARQLEILRTEIANSSLDLQHKSYANDVISEVAEATNGVQDKAQATSEAIYAMTAYMIRRDIIIVADHTKQNEAMRNAVIKAVEDHEMKCPMKVLRMTGGQAAAIVVALAGTAITAILKWG